MTADKSPQWSMWLDINHARSFEHEAVLWCQTRGRDPYRCGRWTWKGVGVPPEMLKDLEGRITSVVSEHVVSRYGIANTLLWEVRDSRGSGSSVRPT